MTFTFVCCTNRITVRIRPGMIMSTVSTSRGDKSDDDGLEIRQRAYDLLNRVGGPEAGGNEKQWPESPSASNHSYQYSSYQQQAAGEASRDSFSAPLRPTPRSSASSSFTEVFVHCVSDACKMASSDVLRSGYDSLRSVVIPDAEERFFAARSRNSYAPVSGTYQTVDIPQGYRGRYTDDPNDGGR